MGEHVIGVDLGGTKILGAAVDASGGMVSRVMELTRAEEGPTAVLGRMVAVIRKAAGDAGLKLEDVACIGIGSPGPLNPDTGVVIFTPNLPGWTDIHVKEYIEEKTGRPVVMDNDVNVGVFGESMMGAGRGVNDIVGLFVGTGIGGGVIIGGKLLHGFSKLAGELGHIVINYGGPECGCGRRGCLEAYASRQAICRSIVEAVKAGRKTVIAETDPMRITTAMMIDALKQNDKVVTKAIRKALRFLGIGMASLAHTVSPEMFIIGGGLVDALDDDMMTYLGKVAKKRALPGVMDGVRIVKAELGENAGVLGAAALARQKAGIIAAAN